MDRSEIEVVGPSDVATGAVTDYVRVCCKGIDRALGAPARWKVVLQRVAGTWPGRSFVVAEAERDPSPSAPRGHGRDPDPLLAVRGAFVHLFETLRTPSTPPGAVAEPDGSDPSDPCASARPA